MRGQGPKNGRHRGAERNREVALKNLKLQRPLVFFDLETTGIDVLSDRIVEISILRVEIDGTQEGRTRRIDPERPIPAAATAIHGIRDEDVQGAPTFRQIAKGLLELIGDADLAGFNILRFDVPLLERELNACGLDLRVPQRRLIDAMTIFHRKERRNLEAAVRFYLGRDHADAHSAEADVAATVELLDAQLERYTDLPRSVDELESWSAGERPTVDRSGKFTWRDGEAVFAFGKHQGKSLRAVAIEAADYLEWVVQADFPAEAKEIVAAALRGEFPEPPDL
jgi:DNA polymerase-3 subunit epsilon